MGVVYQIVRTSYHPVKRPQAVRTPNRVGRARNLPPRALGVRLPYGCV